VRLFAAELNRQQSPKCRKMFNTLKTNSSMKKLLRRNKFFLPLVFLAVMAVGCGLGFKTIEISNPNPAQGEVITVKANLTEVSDNNRHDLYQLYAVRVPIDWEGQGLVAAKDEGTADATDIPMKESKAYADFCEYLFPREGYKWVAYQSKEICKQGATAEATVTLLVGNKTGDYNIDLLVGGWEHDPTLLFDKNGNIVPDAAFGQNVDFTDAVLEQDNSKYHSSEYLMIAGTLSDAEIAATDTRLEAIKINVHDKGEHPVMADVVNRYTEYETLKVTVKEGAGIEGVAAADADAPVEWFTLQGMRVEQPVAGNVYIRRQAGKVSKVFVK